MAQASPCGVRGKTGTRPRPGFVSLRLVLRLGGAAAVPCCWSASNMAPPTDNLYVTELPGGTDEDTLRTVFSGYGVVTQCKVLPSKMQGKCAGLVRVQSA